MPHFTRKYGHKVAFPVLLLLAVAALVFRYTKKTGGLIEIISRDGGVYYLLVAGTRLFGLAFARGLKCSLNSCALRGCGPHHPCGHEGESH